MPFRVRVPELGLAPAPWSDVTERGLRLGRLMWRPLVGSANSLAAPLAVSARQSSGGSVVEVVLDRDAKWSDNVPITAIDVVNTVTFRQRHGAFPGVSAQADGDLKGTMTGRGAVGCTQMLAPSRFVDGTVDTAITSGPYRLASLEPGSATLCRVDKRAADSLPGIAEFVAMADLDEALAALRGGTLDVLIEADEICVSEVIANPGPAIVSLPDTARIVQVLGFNLSREWLAERRTRAYLAQLLNCGELSVHVYQGLARPGRLAQGITDETDRGTAGLPGLTVLTNAENRLRGRAAEWVARAWRASGIQASAESVPWQQFTERLRRGDFDCFLLSVRDSPDSFADLWCGIGGPGMLARLTRYDNTELQNCKREAEPPHAALTPGDYEAARRVISWAVPAVELTVHAAWVICAEGALSGLALVAAATGAPGC